MPLEIINPLEFPNWDDLLLSHKDSNFFHSSSWARVLSESYKYKPLYFTAIENGKISVCIPIMEVKSLFTGKRGIALPFSDYCHPIASERSHFQEVLKKIIEHGKHSGWKYIEFRGGKRYFLDEQPSISFYSHTLELTPDDKKLLATFRSSTKRNIKKAIKEGVEVNSYHSISAVKEFFRLNCLTRKDHGLPPQPYNFFQKIYEHIVSQKLGFVILASYRKRNISASIFLHTGDKAIYKYGASDKNYQNLRANNLVMWEAIKYYAQNGFKIFDFGITELENSGLLQFKRGWGVNEKIMSYYKFDLAKDAFIKDSFRSKVSYNSFRKLPSPLLNLIGHLAYRHIA